MLCVKMPVTQFTNENATYSQSLAVEHQKILEKWQKELNSQTGSFCQNVYEFKAWAQNQELWLEKERVAIRRKVEELKSIETFFHQILQRIESILHIEIPAQTSTFPERLIQILQKLEENQTSMETSTKDKLILESKLRTYKSRDEKLHSLATKLQELSLELEEAINDDPTLEDISNDDDLSENTDNEIIINPELEKSLEESHDDLEAYCQYRKNRDSAGLFTRNYLRFKRCGSEALDQFLHLVEKEFFNLWIQEDRAKLAYQSSYRSVEVQTRGWQNEANIPPPLKLPDSTLRGNKHKNKEENEFSFSAHSKSCQGNQNTGRHKNLPLITISPYIWKPESLSHGSSLGASEASLVREITQDANQTSYFEKPAISEQPLLPLEVKHDSAPATFFNEWFLESHRENVDWSSAGDSHP